MPDRYLLVLVREPEPEHRSIGTSRMARVRKILHRGLEDYPGTLGVADIPVPKHLTAEADSLMEASARYVNARWPGTQQVWDPRGKPVEPDPWWRRALTSVTSRR